MQDAILARVGSDVPRRNPGKGSLRHPAAGAGSGGSRGRHQGLDLVDAKGRQQPRFRSWTPTSRRSTTRRRTTPTRTPTSVTARSARRRPSELVAQGGPAHPYSCPCARRRPELGRQDAHQAGRRHGGPGSCRAGCRAEHHRSAGLLPRRRRAEGSRRRRPGLHFDHKVDHVMTNDPEPVGLGAGRHRPQPINGYWDSDHAGFSARSCSLGAGPAPGCAPRAAEVD